MTYQIDGVDYTERDYKLDLKIVKTPRILREARNLRLLSSKTIEQTFQKITFLEDLMGWKGLKGISGISIPFDQCSEERIGNAFRNTLVPYLKLEPRADVTEVARAQYRIDKYEPVRDKVTLEDAFEKTRKNLARKHEAETKRRRKQDPEQVRKNHSDAIRN